MKNGCSDYFYQVKKVSLIENESLFLIQTYINNEFIVYPVMAEQKDNELHINESQYSDIFEGEYNFIKL